MTHTYESLTDASLSSLGTQVKPNTGFHSWYRLGSSLAALLVAAAIWHYKIAPDDNSPSKRIVAPATELLSSFVQPAPNMDWLSKDLGFKVDVPDLKQLGVEVTTVGESQLGGAPAAVMQYQKGYSVFLFYSFRGLANLVDEMRSVDSDGNRFYVTSEGAVSVVVWKDRSDRFHAVAAKLTEGDLITLATSVARLA